MHSFIRSLLLLLVLSFTPALKADDWDDTNFGVQIGYRHDNFKIVTRKTDNPIFITKQDWSDVQSWTLGIDGETCTEYNVYIRGKIVYGWNNTSKFHYETPLVDPNLIHVKGGPHGRNYEANFAIGFPIWWNWCNNCCDTLRFIPLVGFSWNRMNFKSKGRIANNSDVFLDSSSSDSAVSSKTSSKSQVIFKAPWAGFDVFLPCGACWLYGSYEFHWGLMSSHGEYKGKPTFKFHTSDKAKGFANVVHAGIGYQFWSDWEALLTFNASQWKLRRGHDKTRLIFDNTTFRDKIRLQKANWYSWSATFDLLLQF